MSTSVPPPGMSESAAPHPQGPEPQAPEQRVPQPSGGRQAPRLTRLPRLVMLLAAVAALAVIAFVAFGSSANKTLDPVAQAATVSAASPGTAIRMSIRVSSGSTTLDGHGSGSFDARDHAGSMSLTFDTPQGTEALQEVIVGTTVYVKIPASLSGSLPLGGKQWISIDLSKLRAIPGAASLLNNPAGGDPSQMLQYLRAVSDSVVSVGSEKVDGFQTTRYRADIELDRVPAALPASARASAQTAITALENETHVRQFPVDVWVDGHHLVRRMTMSFSPSLPTGQTLNETFTIDFVRYGAQPRPTPPPAAQVTDLSGLIS